ncbi:MAG: dUTP diphosphatase [Bacillota bacterium]|nr:dUTP diphosphatase [Bacillota bacterium]
MSALAWEISVKVKRLSPLVGQRIGWPFYATEGAAGLDLAACLEAPLSIPPGQRAMIPTGIAVEIPSRFLVGLVFPRSGLASRHGISLANAVGVIDSDYKGEIICPVQNNSQQEYTVHPGDRIAQLVFVPIAVARLELAEELEPTRRGSGGFGSTGK